mmetsp:Transcript_41914/g.84112  ORF Transcript_41914/g.84112 Transcript_41914/m.84112 type:complete len:128 (-) Transcript_41914:207-590(-)
MAAVQKGRERFSDQLSSILNELGPMPELPEDAQNEWRPPAEELGLWAAALLNPLPALGLAPEIRQRALESTDSISRIHLVLGAAEVSLAHMLRPRLSLIRWFDLRDVNVPLVALGGVMVALTVVLTW